jgi:hypothetical protein
MKYAVSVSLAEFLRPLKWFTKNRKKFPVMAVFSWSDGRLVIELPGGAAEILAEGEWPGSVRVKGEFLRGIARVPPTSDPLLIAVREGRLWIGDTSFPCESDTESQGSAILLPENPPLDALLSLKEEHSESEIIHSGYLSLTRQAEQRRDELINRALKHLSPLGVGLRDLRLLVDECVRRKQNSGGGSPC